MQLNGTTLQCMKDSYEDFNNIYTRFSIEQLEEVCLFPRLAEDRLIQARKAWKKDIKRSTHHEKNLSDGPDHFKQAGYLAFWLRKYLPIISINDEKDNFSDAPGYDLSADQKEVRKTFGRYWNEYVAFNFGFQLVKLYEMGRNDIDSEPNDLKLSRDFYRDMANVMKYKAISPHSLNMIYRSLFVF